MKCAEFEVSLADDDYVEFSVPAGYFYGVEELANASEDIVDSAGVKYNAYITAEADNMSH